MNQITNTLSDHLSTTNFSFYLFTIVLLYGVNKTQWFTLIEMMIVMSIIAILFLIIRTQFQSPNIYTSQAESCLQNIYGASQSMILAGLTQRWLQTWDETIFPSQYHIYFNTTGQKIQTAYDTQINEEILLQTSNSRWCYDNNYQVQITGTDTHIYIEQTNMIANAFTGDIQFMFCTQGDCKPLGTIHYDTRAQQLYLYLCSSNQTDFCL